MPIAHSTTASNTEKEIMGKFQFVCIADSPSKQATVELVTATRKSPLRILAGEGASFLATGTGGESVLIGQPATGS